MGHRTRIEMIFSPLTADIYTIFLPAANLKTNYYTDLDLSDISIVHSAMLSMQIL